MAAVRAIKYQKHGVEFKNHAGEILRGVLFEPLQYDDVIVVLHGFPGTMSGAGARRAGPSFAKLGHAVLLFDFSGSGTSDGDFSHKLMSKEVREVKYATDFVAKLCPGKRIVLYGHSTGAIDAGLYAFRDTRISTLVLAGCTGKLSLAARYAFNDEQVHSFWTKGFIRYSRPDRWYDGKKIYKPYYDEFFTLDLLGSIHKYRGSVLIVHGEKDEAVPVKHVKEVAAVVRGRKRVVIVRGADHSFRKPAHWAQVVRAVDGFVRRR